VTKNARPLVTVIIPSYNYGQYLGECLTSVLEQTVQDLEIIVINDGSTDNTADVLRGFTDTRIRYIDHGVNRGLLATLTEGFSAARGEYVARIDADDRYRPHFLQETIPILEARPEVGLVYGDVALIDEAGHIVEDPWAEIQSNQWHRGADAEGDEFLIQIENNLIPTAAVVARRQAWLEAVPFPDWFGFPSISDWYLNVCIARGGNVYYRAQTLGEYRFHPQNMHTQPYDVSAAETTIFRTLDQLFAGPDRAEQKRALKSRVYARTHAATGDRYFGFAMNRSARRSYLQALRRRPAYLLDAAFMRRLCATTVPRETYDSWKRGARSIQSLWSGARE
jgi:glycosyltransferase involved in cell wall biosynthesis